MGRNGLLIVAICLMAVAGCGKRERTTVTTTVRTTPAAATAGGVAGVSASGVTTGGNAAARGGTAKQAQSAPTSQAVASGNRRHPTDFSKLLLGGAVAGTIVGAANGPTLGLNQPPSPTLAGAAGGQQCTNPFGGENAANGQAICSDQAEQLQCQCTDDGCQLVQTNTFACTPVGAVVN